MLWADGAGFQRPATDTLNDESLGFGTPITLAELRELGEFVRFQDLPARLAGLHASKRLPLGYPLVPSRLAPNPFVDLLVGDRWKQVRFLREEGTAMGGNRRILFEEGGQDRSLRYDWYGVAPAGHFTHWNRPKPANLEEAQLLETYELAQQDHVIHEQSLKEVDWPYLTFNVSSYHPKVQNFELEKLWHGTYTVHAADPRVRVKGITPRECWFNTTIAVSHRWLGSPDHPDPERLHPDPERLQHRELMKLCDDLGLQETQAFLIDYCSLPQLPRTPEEQAWFLENLPGFQSQYKYVTLVLNTGAADYAKRAWCMFELMLAAMSRAKRPTLLNHAQLDGPLQAARKEAANLLALTGWNQQNMLAAFGGGLTHESFAQFARNPQFVMIYKERIDGRRQLLEKFEKELLVTDPADRVLIVDLLKRLALA